jgi:hypothetical protein
MMNYCFYGWKYIAFRPIRMFILEVWRESSRAQGGLNVVRFIFDYYTRPRKRR